jgi:type IV secretion system protein VirB11
MSENRMIMTNATRSNRVDQQIDLLPKVQQSVAKRLRPIYEHLLHDQVEEIAINQPGEIWRRMRKPDDQGRLWIPYVDQRLSAQYLANICHQIANLQSIPHFGPDGMPLVFGTIPGGHRFGAGIGFNVQYGTPDAYSPDGSICICVRQYVTENPINLIDYGIRPQETVRPALKSMFSKDADPNDDYVRIVNSLTRGDHILVSGETGSGKTTLLNRLIQYIDPAKRIITVEDTRELRVNQPNRVHVVMSRTGQANRMTYHSVRDLIVRMTPDIVMAGEISQINAATIHELMTTGHGHFMTTIHASSPDEAITTFINCISNARAAAGNTDAIDRSALRQQLQDKLRIIQVERDAMGARRATAIH